MGTAKKPEYRAPTLSRFTDADEVRAHFSQAADPKSDADVEEFLGKSQALLSTGSVKPRE